jgi:hypothetical protein
MSDRKFKFLPFITFGFLIIMYSCILDEYKFGKIHLKDWWEMEIVSPLFYGDFHFKDLAYNQNSVPLHNGKPLSVMVSPTDTFTVPENIFYEPALIVEGFNFLIEGDDYLSSAILHFTVSNGCPFPLQLQMYFYEKEKPAEKGPAFTTSYFAAGIINEKEVLPFKTIYSLVFTPEQLESFKKANRIDLISTFDKPEDGFKTDTVRADYPLNISIVFSGTIHGKYE